MFGFFLSLFMRNLIAFFQKFRIFLLFAVLQIYSLYLYFTYLEFPKSQYLTSANQVVGEIYKVEHDLTKHFNLSKNNTKLQRENIRLRSKLPQSFIPIDKTLYKINDSVFKQQYAYIAGEVINSTVTRKNNYFTLNVGRIHGVKKGMGVFSDRGVVGIIHNTSKHFSVVKTVLTSDINIDVMIEKTGLFGLLKWDGINPKLGSISGISNDIRIKKWSKVVTRGGAGIFPKGIPVGKIKTLKTIEGKPIWDVVIQFSENYQSLQRVYIVKNLLLEEQQNIESLNQADE